MPHGAREIFRLRVAPSGQVSFARELIPELIPPAMRGANACGQKLGWFGHRTVYRRLRSAFERAKRTQRAERVTWMSILTGKPRLAVLLPLRDGGVMVRIFAEAEEVAGLTDDRRADGTDGE